METIITILFPVTFIAALVLERVFPARPLPKVKGWLLKGIAFFVMSAVLGGVVPALLASTVADKAPFKLAWLGAGWGGLLAFVVSDLFGYAAHRTLHNVPFLWRWTHQMHHSAERMDVAGSAYFHPFDIIVQAGLANVVVGLLGVTPEAALMAGYLTFFAGIFQHLNVKTPRWLGYLIQRPEAHSVHHERGVHAYNYGNFLMVWDLVLGTFRNPEKFVAQAGFWHGASGRVGAMLIGRDVSLPAEPAPPPSSAALAGAE